MIRNKTVMIILILVTLLAASCDLSQIENAPPRRSNNQLLVKQYVLKKTDLPGAGWSIEGEGWEYDFGGEGYGIVFIRDQHVFVTHSLSIYPNEEQAQQALKESENKWIKLTNIQPTIPYVSSNQKDDYLSGCYQEQPTYPLIICIYLQRHNQIISFVKVNLDSGSANTLKFDEVNNMLSVLDKRVNEMSVASTP